MVGFVVPVLADNPPAYSLVLVSFHLEARRPQGGRGSSTWVQETFDSLMERESRFERNGG